MSETTIENTIFDIIKSSGVTPGTVVISTAGHDFGRLYLVVERKEKIAYLVDGRTRHTDKPKMKRVTHIKALGVIAKPEEGIIALANMGNTEERNIYIREVLREFLDKNLK